MSNPLDNSDQRKVLLELVSMKMPFGKYKGSFLCDLPEYYLVWYRQKGFPKGRIGILMETLYEIKLNGLEKLLDPLKKTEIDLKVFP